MKIRLLQTKLNTMKIFNFKIKYIITIVNIQKKKKIYFLRNNIHFCFRIT